jgi:WD40 repeat protein
MDHYPVVACGSASGSIYLVDLEKDRILASAKAHLHFQDEARGSSDVVKKQAMEKLYGKLDGGGVISIAMRGNVIASSGREGGVKIWKIISSKDHETQLVQMGSLSSLHNTIVTSVKFADSSDLLWVSCYDGTVRSYDISQWGNEGNSSQENLYPQQKPLYRTDFTDSVLEFMQRIEHWSMCNVRWRLSSFL